jgi:hypothetical protein
MKKILFSILYILFCLNANATIWFVTQSGNGLQNGTSWANASADLASVIKNANAGDEVWIAGGTYLPKYDGSGADVSTGNSFQKAKAFFNLSNGVSLFGGFNGSENSKNQRSFNVLNSNIANGTNFTRLSGDVNNTPLDMVDNAGMVIGVKDLNVQVSIDGIIIQDANSANVSGNGFFSNLSISIGGGIVNFNTNNLLSINNCKFNNNMSTALANIAFSYDSGDKYCLSSIQNCYFFENYNGGGTSYTIYNYADGSIANGTFAYCKPQIKNCVLRENTTLSAIANIAGQKAESSGLIENCILYKNGSSNYGGTAIDNNASTWAMNQGTQSVCKPKIINTIVAFGYGYAVNNRQTDITGGRLCEPQFINTTILGNTGQAFNPPFDNQLYQVINSGCNPIFVNSIVWSDLNNVQSIYDRTTQNGTGGGTNAAVPAITFSNIKGAYIGAGNINLKPLFVNTTSPEGIDGIYFTDDDGFQNANSSPAIDAGTLSIALADIIAVNRPVGVAFDMGAYEGNKNAICSPVEVTNIISTNITLNTATLNWVDIFNNGTQNYDIYISKLNTPPNNLTLPSFTTPLQTYNLSSLDYGTNYYLWIRSSCPDLKSNWVGSNFSTVCLNTAGSASATISVIEGALNACLNSSITFQVNVTNFATPVNNYAWFIGSNLVSSGNSQSAFTTSLAQTGTVYCEVSTISGACGFNNSYAVSNSLSMNAPSNITPTLNIYRTYANGTNYGASMKICNGEPTYFATQLNNDALGGLYQWYINGNPINGATSSTFTSTNIQESDVITCTFLPNNTCLSVNLINSNALTAIVYPVVTPTININSNIGFSYCNIGATNNASLTLNTTNTTSPSSTGNPIYNWILNGNNVGSNINYYLPNVQNGDVITCTMQTFHTCATTNMVNDTKTFSEINAGPQPSISISTNTIGNNVCSGSQVIYTANIANAGQNFSVKWYKNNTLQIGETGLTYTIPSYTQFGVEVYAVLTPDNMCYPGNSSSNTIQLMLNPQLTPTVTLSNSLGNMNITGCLIDYPAGAIVAHLTANTTNAGANPTYNWYVDGTFFPFASGVGDAYKTFMYASSGFISTHHITVEVINNESACLSNNIAVSNNSFQFVLLPTETKTLQITASHPNPIFEGSTIQFLANPYPSFFNLNYTYSWYINNIEVYTSNTTEYINNGTLQNGDVVKCVTFLNDNSNFCVVVGNTTSNEIIIQTTSGVCPTLISPSNNAANIAVTGTQLNWNSITDAASYDVYINDTYAGNSTTTNYWTNSNLQSNTMYTWYVVPKDILGNYMSFTCQQNQFNFTTENVNPIQFADDCVAALNLFENNPINSSTSNATQSLPAALCDMNGAMMPQVNDVWFVINQINFNEVHIEISNYQAGFQPIIELYTGDCMMGLNSFDCFAGSNYSTWLNQGTYYVRIYGSAGMNDNFTVTLNPSINFIIPEVNITIIEGAQTICEGNSVSFMATPINGGISPTYQWYKNNLPVGINNNIYSDSNLVNTDVIYCYLFSSETNASPNSVMSNIITMEVNEQLTWYLDADADGYYVSTQLSCDSPGIGYINSLPINGYGDCNDNINSVHAVPQASQITAQGNTTFCTGSNVVLVGNTGGIWNNGSTASTITLTNSGIYFVTNSNACGNVNSNQIIVTVNNCNNVPTTKLRMIDCGKLGLLPNAQIVCVAVPGATNYEFEFKDAQTGALFASKITNSNTIAPIQLNPTLLWNTQYYCRIRAKVAGNWGLFGDACLIGIAQNPAMVGVPITQLDNSWCNKFNINSNASIACIQVSMASAYDFEFTDTITGQSIIKNTATKYCPLTSISPNLLSNRIYRVRVRAKQYNSWGNFANVCYIKIVTSNNNRQSLESNENDVEELIENEGVSIIEPNLIIELFPNPIEDISNLKVTTPEDEILLAQIIDLTGKLIWSSKFQSNHNFRLNNLNVNTGIYFLTVTNNEGEFKSTKLIVK